MRRLIFTIFLLTKVMSDDNLTNNNRQEASSPVVEKQFWSKRGKRIPREAIHLEFEDFSDSRVSAKPLQLPPPSVLRHVDGKSCLHYDPSSSRDSDCRLILVSLDYRNYFDDKDQFGVKCTAEKCVRRHLRQSPFYVEEPSWISIDNNDYMENTAAERSVNPSDPYVLSRGKKVQRIKDTLDGARERTQGDYDDYWGTKGRIVNLPIVARLLRNRRSMVADKFEKKRNEDQDLTKKGDQTKTSESRKIGNTLIGTFGRYEDPFFLSRGKKMRVENEIDDRDGNEIMDNFNRPNRRGKRSLASSRENGENYSNDRKESAGVSNFLKESLLDESTRDAPRNRSDDVDIYKRPSDYYLKKIQEGGNLKYRTKRDNYGGVRSTDESTIEKDPKNFADSNNKLDIDIDKIIADENYVERRNGHSNILDILQQPFFISRGKKAYNEGTASMEDQRQCEYINLSKNIILREILGRLIESLRCTSKEGMDEFGKIVKRKTPRDRRGALDELLARYDPFYVARGKRILFDDYLTKMHSAKR